MKASSILNKLNLFRRGGTAPAILGSVTIMFLLSGCQTLTQSGKNTVQEPSTKTVTSAPAPVEASPQKKAAEKLLNKQSTLPEQTAVNRHSQPTFSLKPPGLAEEEGSVRIAILLPLTGQHKKIGNDLLRAAYMALFDHANKKLLLLPYDTEGTIEGAKKAALAATGEGAEIILGPLFSASVNAIRPITAANNVNILAFSTDTQVAGDGVYLMGLTAGQQVSRIMEYSYRQGLNRIAVLAPQSPYGDAVIKDVQRSSLRLGLQIDKIRRYPTNLAPGSEELHEIAKEIADYDARNWQLKQEIKKLKGKPDPASKALLKKLEKLDTIGNVSFDALIIPDGGQRLRELAPLLSYYDIDPTEIQFIGTGLWADQGLTSEPALVGGWYAAPSPEKTKQFQGRFQQLYDYIPPRIASLAYDATALSGLLALEARENKFSREVLESPDGFSGYNGVFRFPTSGVAERGLAVMQVGQQELELLEPSPQSFDALLN